MNNQETYPLLPMKGVVVFPNSVFPLFIGREKSVAAIKAAVDRDDKKLVLVTQKNADDDNPSFDDLYNIGVLGTVMQLLRLPDGTYKAMIEVEKRVKISHFIGHETHSEARIDDFPSEKTEEDLTPLFNELYESFEFFLKEKGEIPAEASLKRDEESPEKMVNHAFWRVEGTLEEKQGYLEIAKLEDQMRKAIEVLTKTAHNVKAEKDVKGRVRNQMEKAHREFYLNQQMKAIQDELGEQDEGNVISDMEEIALKKNLSVEAKKAVDKEIKKLKAMSPMSPESTVSRNYVDWILSLPWNEKSRLKKDLHRAEEKLNEQHFGLDKVKERILEYLAVQSRSPKIRGPILCLVGPPGVGKTSLGKSIAEATGREFVRISLGGVNDENDIRGHRRTYIGSMPGKIIQAMKKAGKSNPVILLDEIDKIGHSHRGDPASALLEVLDPEQNNTFSDHYLEVDYDLSDVMFITTANSYDMHEALLDRMEIISVESYTEDEKLQIALRHLVPKQMKANGVKKGELEITEGAIRQLIRGYTREAGVRNLERDIGKVMRKAVTQIVRKETQQVRVDENNLKEFLGVVKHKTEIADKEDQIGVVNGLAWTSVGGTILQIEAVRLPGKGQFKTTGKLGDVMKESIDAASSYVKSIAPTVGVKPTKFEGTDIHVHVPAGATPKDGPSAGLAMASAMISVMTGIPVRQDVAMTGEISLRGNALPIGGLKEKLLGALRGNIKTVVIPEENVKDLEDVPQTVKDALEIVPVSHMREVIPIILSKQPETIEWDEAAEAEAAEKRRMSFYQAMKH